MLKVPLLHIIIALKVDVIEHTLLDHKIGGIVGAGLMVDLLQHIFLVTSVTR